jgi:hypothetical protein
MHDPTVAHVCVCTFANILNDVFADVTGILSNKMAVCMRDVNVFVCVCGCCVGRHVTINVQQCHVEA